jgi:hypothetical protein
MVFLTMALINVRKSNGYFPERNRINQMYFSRNVNKLALETAVDLI